MSIVIKDHEPEVTLKVRELRQIHEAMDTSRAELEAAVADGDVKEEVLDAVLEALAVVRSYL